MSIRRTASAPLRNTFGVQAQAGVLIECDETDELAALLTGELAGATPLVVGGGSNLLIVEGPALALAPTARAMRVLARWHAREGVQAGAGAHEDAATIVRADAGVEWDGFVRWTLAQGLAGLENLALIPGTVGASPIQNIGAYGVEVGERIHAVEAIDRRDGSVQRFSAADCAFAYRDSVFKHDLDRWLIVAVEFALPSADSIGMDGLRLDYSGIREELAAMGLHAAGARDASTAITPARVCEAVTRLRQRKLPDPAVVGNAGSFFKNPIVPAATADALKSEHPALPIFPAGDAALRKLSAAWLIDASGWKGRRWPEGSGDAGVSERHALVLVNHGRASGAELLALARAVAADVETSFGIRIEPEPRLVGATW